MNVLGSKDLKNAYKMSTVQYNGNLIVYFEYNFLEINKRQQIRTYE